jgi:hypothetical protein
MILICVGLATILSTFSGCDCLYVWMSSSVLRCQLKTLGANHGAGIHFWDLRITMLDYFARVSHCFY